MASKDPRNYRPMWAAFRAVERGDLHELKELVESGKVSVSDAFVSSTDVDFPEFMNAGETIFDLIKRILGKEYDSIDIFKKSFIAAIKERSKSKDFPVQKRNCADCWDRHSKIANYIMTLVDAEERK